MGKILAGYKSAVISDIIQSNNYYYMVASNPIPSLTIPPLSNNDYSTLFVDGWQMLFGKRVKSTDILPVVRNIQWETGIVYDHYDNTIDMTNKNFYVVTPPAEVGGDYLIFKCIDNNNGAASTVEPNLVQAEVFTTIADNYKWKYITSITTEDYDKFGTTSYIPIYGDINFQGEALEYSGVEVVVVANSGNGYSSYHDGVIQSVQSATELQIEGTASINNDFYVNNAIYIYNDESPTANLQVISGYVSNQSGKWVILQSEVNVNIIDPGVTKYKISPRVVFKTNGNTQPSAYSVVNTASNSINNIVVTDVGSGITWANVHLESNTIFGSGANVYAVVAPPGGHGFDPTDELPVKGFCIATTFANTENNTIPTEDIIYNKIALIKNPHNLNNSTGGKLETLMTANSFSAVANFTPLSGQVFDVGDTVTGANSGAVGTVAFSNSTVLMLTGDKTFIDLETITSSDGLTFDDIEINTLGDVFTKDIRPIYVQNLLDVRRSNTTSESYKLIIQV